MTDAREEKMEGAQLALFDMVRAIREKLARSPGMEEAPFSREGWDMIEAALTTHGTRSAITRHTAEVRLNDDLTLDEVVTPDGDQLEQMDGNHWFLQIGDVDVWLHAKGKITATYERRRSAPSTEGVNGDLSFSLTDYINSLKWSEQATDHEKTLVVGNLRAMFAVIQKKHNALVGAAMTISEGFGQYDELFKALERDGHIKIEGDKVTVLRSAPSSTTRIETALRNLLKQVDDFCAKEGEANFYTGEAVEALGGYAGDPVAAPEPSSAEQDTEKFDPTTNLADANERIEELEALRDKLVTALKQEDAEQSSAARGEWRIRREKLGEWRICSEDFTHDVELVLTGDFEDDDKRMEYAADIARKLSVPSANGGNTK